MNFDMKLIDTILTDFIRNETDRIGIKKAVIGLSGGVDSSVSAFLAAKALGSENVTGVMMPYKSSSKSSLTDAKKVVKSLGIKSKKIEITPMVDAYTENSGIKKFTPKRLGNIMARMRMIVLYDLSAMLDALVIGTGNKTEAMLGYTTIYGDNACAINPLGDLYKSQVWELAKYLGVPESIINKPPSADLWEGQTDEAEMGVRYKDVDRYLFYRYDEKMTEEELMKRGFTEDYINRIDSMVERNKFKRSLPIVGRIYEE